MPNHTEPAADPAGWPRTSPPVPKAEAMDRLYAGVCEDAARAAVEGRIPTQDGAESAA